MFSKLIVLVLCVGLGGAVLLAMRQARIQAAHELADAKLRVMQRDNDLRLLRARIAAGVTPQRVEQLAAGMSEFRPIAADMRAPEEGAAVAGVGSAGGGP